MPFSSSLSINPPPSLSLNPSLSIPSSSSTTTLVGFYYPFGRNPINLFSKKTHSLQSLRPIKLRNQTPISAKSRNMTISEIRQEDGENPPPYVESEITTRPRRIALFVEPSPFAWVFVSWSFISYAFILVHFVSLE